MGANRFMKPQKADYFQTYVSQYVPQPFELMQRAVDRIQDQYDAVEAQTQKMENYLINIASHSGRDTEDIQAISSYFSDLTNEALSDPDLNQAEKRVYEIGKQLGRDPKIRQLLASGAAEKKLDAHLDEARQKTVGEGGIYGHKEIVYEDYRQEHREKGVLDTGRIFTQDFKPSVNVNERAMKYASQMKPSTVSDYAGQYKGSFDEIHQFVDRNYKGLDFNDVKAATVIAMREDAEVMEELRYKAAVEKSQRTGVRPAEAFRQLTSDDLNEQLVRLAMAPAAAFSFIEGDTKAQMMKGTGFSAGEESAKNPILEITSPVQSEVVGASKTKSIETLTQSINSLDAQIQKEATKIGASQIGELGDYFTGDFDPSVSSKLRSLQAQKKNLELRKQEAQENARDVELERTYVDPIRSDLERLNINTFEFLGLASPEGLKDKNSIYHKMAMSGYISPSDKNNYVVPSLYKTLTGKEYTEEAMEMTPPAQVWELSQSEQYDPAIYESAKTVATQLTKRNEKVDAYTKKINNYLENTAKGFMSTHTGSNVAWVHDANGANEKLTKELNKIVETKFKDPQELLGFTGVVYKRDDDGKMTPGEPQDIGEFIQQKREQLPENRKEVKISKFRYPRTRGADGNFFVEAYVEDTPVHIPITEGQFGELFKPLNTPSRRVDAYLLQALNTGLTEVPIEFEEYGKKKTATVKIARDPKSILQQGDYSFANDEKFIILKPRNLQTGKQERVTGQAAFSYLKALELKGLLK